MSLSLRSPVRGRILGYHQSAIANGFLRRRNGHLLVREAADLRFEFDELAGAGKTTLLGRTISTLYKQIVFSHPARDLSAAWLNRPVGRLSILRSFSLCW